MKDTIDVIKESFNRGFAVSTKMRLTKEDIMFQEAEPEELLELLVNLEDYGYITISQRYKTSEGIWIRQGENYGNL